MSSQIESDFTRFIASNPNWEQELDIYTRDDPVYKRIKCTWTENELVHEYHSVINTLTGRIYLDCRKRKIFCKLALFSILQPVVICIKTLWHASIVLPFALEVEKFLNKKQSLYDLKNHTFQSLADIVRTPVYGLAMTVLAIASCALAFIRPNSIYKMRDAVVNLQKRLLRDQLYFVVDGSPEEKILRNNSLYDTWNIFPCFYPIYIIYDNSGSKWLKENVKPYICERQVETRRDERMLFNDCLMLHPQDKAYISAAKPKDI